MTSETLRENGPEGNRGANLSGPGEALMRAARQALERARTLFIEAEQARNLAAQELADARRTGEEIRNQARSAAETDAVERSRLIEDERRRTSEAIDQERSFLQRAIAEVEQYAREARDLRDDAERERVRAQSLRAEAESIRQEALNLLTRTTVGEETPAIPETGLDPAASRAGEPAVDDLPVADLITPVPRSTPGDPTTAARPEESDPEEDPVAMQMPRSEPVIVPEPSPPPRPSDPDLEAPPRVEPEIIRPSDPPSSAPGSPDQASVGGDKPEDGTNLGRSLSDMLNAAFVQETSGEPAPPEPGPPPVTEGTETPPPATEKSAFEESLADALGQTASETGASDISEIVETAAQEASSEAAPSRRPARSAYSGEFSTLLSPTPSAEVVGQVWTAVEELVGIGRVISSAPATD